MSHPIFRIYIIFIEYTATYLPNLVSQAAIIAEIYAFKQSNAEI